MKYAILSLAVFFTTASSFASSGSTDLLCNIDYNYEPHKVEVKSLQEGEKDRVVDRLEEYTLFITSLGGDKYELQAYDKLRLMRSYATSRINGDTSIQLSLWKRESLLEASCFLK